MGRLAGFRYREVARRSRRSSSRLASAELLLGSNCLSQTNRVTPAAAVTDRQPARRSLRRLDRGVAADP